ncbi:MAG: hypothetical protein ACRDMZ_10375, partial [Solirubrobacteraceae bacterium]
MTAALRTTSDDDILRTASVLAMERLCYASPEAFLDEPPAVDALEAWVAFRGQSSGAVSIAVPACSVGGFIEGLLLPDARTDGLTADDFVAELANIVCGNAVPRIFGRNAIHVLSPPQPGRPDGPAIATAVVELTGGWVAATLHR